MRSTTVFFFGKSIPRVVRVPDVGDRHRRAERRRADPSCSQASTPSLATAAEVDAPAATATSTAPGGESGRAAALCRMPARIQSAAARMSAPNGDAAGRIERRGPARRPRAPRAPPAAGVARRARAPSARQKPKTASTSTPCICGCSSARERERGRRSRRGSRRRTGRRRARRSRAGRRAPACRARPRQRSSAAGTASASRSQSRGASAGASASARTTSTSARARAAPRAEARRRRSARPGSCRRRAVLAMRLPGRGARAPSTAASESPRRTAATATPAGLQAQQLRLHPRRPPGEARRVDPDEADPLAARARAGSSLVASAARDARRHDHRLERARGRARTRARAAPRPDASRRAPRPRAARAPRASRPRATRPARSGAAAVLSARTARRPCAACARRIEPAARTWTSKLSPATALGVRVEDDRDLVARRVLELLHHQLAPPRGRRPVHLPERLAPLVLAHRVQVEARRAPEQQPPAVLGVRAALGEQPVERDEARVDDERAAGGELHLRRGRGRTGSSIAARASSKA